MLSGLPKEPSTLGLPPCPYLIYYQCFLWDSDWDRAYQPFHWRKDSFHHQGKQKPTKKQVCTMAPAHPPENTGTLSPKLASFFLFFFPFVFLKQSFTMSFRLALGSLRSWGPLQTHFPASTSKAQELRVCCRVWLLPSEHQGWNNYRFLRNCENITASSHEPIYPASPKWRIRTPLYYQRQETVPNRH